MNNLLNYWRVMKTFFNYSAFWDGLTCPLFFGVMIFNYKYSFIGTIAEDFCCIAYPVVIYLYMHVRQKEMEQNNHEDNNETISKVKEQLNYASIACGSLLAIVVLLKNHG